MSFLASAVIQRARYTLLDESAVAWSNAELYSYLNGGMTQLVSIKPDAYPRVASLTLVAGTWQSLPDDGVLFLDAVQNTAGGFVTVQAAHEFVRVHPTWAADTASANVSYVLFDPRLPTNFNVYPPATAGATLRVKYGAMAEPVVPTTQETVDFPAWYETPLWAFVVGSAYAKNGKRQDLAKFQQFMSMFMQAVAGNTASERSTAPAADPKGVA